MKSPLTIEYIENQLSYWQKVKRVWEKTYTIDDGFNTFVYYIYLHASNTEAVASAINELGYRVESRAGNQVKYKGTDISSIIRSVDIEDSELQEICRDIINQNTSRVNFRYN